MKKIISARLYVNQDMSEENLKQAIEKLDMILEPWNIYYEAYLAEYQDKNIVGFDIVIEGNTFKDCEESYKYMKRLIKSVTGKYPGQILKAKSEKLW